MPNYFKIILESRNRAKYADECRSNSFIGVDYGVDVDLTSYLSEDLSEFKDKFIPVYLATNQGKKKLADQIAEQLWTFCKGVQVGDIVVCPNGRGTLYFGTVVGGYFYHPEEGILQHRRTVEWLPATIRRKKIGKELNEALKTKSPSLMLTQYSEELDKYIRDYEIIDPQTSLPMTKEKLLEEFFVENWEHTELGKLYDIFEEDGEIVGQQYPAGSDSIDILAESKDKKELLVIELKRGKASYAVVGQILNYMGFVQNELAKKKGQLVKGIIIASENDKRIKSALINTPNIKFLRYQVSLNLIEDSDA